MRTDSNETKKKWLKAANESLTRLMTADNGTMLDSLLFHDQFGNVLCAMPGYPIKFHDAADKDVKILRATRLKFLGYSWNSEDRGWILKKD